MLPRVCLIFVAILSFTTSPLFAQSLTLDRVLQSSLDHFPQIQAALSDIEAARGELQAAKGPFDLTLNNTLSARIRGFFSGDFHDTEIVKRFQDFNARVALGYRQSQGDFPIYEDILFTNEDGEVSLSVALSLLRNRDIDSDRFGILRSEVAFEQSRLSAILTQVSVQRRAFLAYLNWLSAGKELQVYQELLEIALERDEALKKRAEQGDVAEITLVENQQFIVQRRAIFLQAKRDFENAANILSLFVRDEAGKPRAALVSELPENFPDLDKRLFDDVTTEVDRVLDVSPEVSQLENEMRLAKGQIALGENSIRPKLDLELYNAEDFGFGENGSPTREGFESVVTLNLSFNLQQNLGRGQVQKGRATLKKLEFQKQQLAEQLTASLLNIVNNINTASDIVALSEQEIDVTARMERAERTKFDNGQSDFFLVNIREVNQADARVKNVIAQKNYLESLGNYMVATLDFESLGLNPI